MRPMVEVIKVEAMEWALQQFAEAINYVTREKTTETMEEVWDRFFEPPVFSLGLDRTTKAVVMQTLYRVSS
jgi:hypothetical protein